MSIDTPPVGSPPSAARRRLLVAAAALPASALPLQAAAQPSAAAGALARKRLIVITLAGGNDGLNTLIPYADPLYRRLRPTLAHARENILPLDAALGLHPSLRAAMTMYQAGELAVVPDVGYPQPNLSHFESAAIWDSADVRRGTAATSGWWGEVVMRNRTAFDAARLDTAAVTFERAAAFANGQRVPVLRAQQDMAALFSPRRPRLAQTPAAHTGTVRYLADMIDVGEAVRDRVAARLRDVPLPKWRPYEEPVDVQLRLTDWMLGHGVTTPLVRLVLDGFDTHSELMARHADRLTALDRMLAGLRANLVAAGLWNDTVILVQSEFGRRPAENGFGGTDHGTAGPLLLAGGRVQGGVHGARSSLETLDHDGNPVFATDFRCVYASVVAGLFGLDANPFAEAGCAPLPIRLA